MTEHIPTEEKSRSEERLLKLLQEAGAREVVLTDEKGNNAELRFILQDEVIIIEGEWRGDDSGGLNIRTYPAPLTHQPEICKGSVFVSHIVGNDEQDKLLLTVLQLLHFTYGNRLRIIARSPFQRMTYRGFLRQKASLKRIEFSLMDEANPRDPEPRTGPPRKLSEEAEAALTKQKEEQEKATMPFCLEAIRAALVKASQSSASISDSDRSDFLNAIALLDKHLSGWQLPEDQLDGGFDLEWMKAVLGVDGFYQWPFCWLTSELSFNVDDMKVRFDGAEVSEVSTRQQFIHLLEALGQTAFPVNPEMREVVEPELEEATIEHADAIDRSFSPLVQTLGIALKLMEGLDDEHISHAARTPLRYAYHAQRSKELAPSLQPLESPAHIDLNGADHPRPKAKGFVAADLWIPGQQ